MFVAAGLGISGFSGVSGFSGRSGFSGASGSGLSGISGSSGYSGASGPTGDSGASGYKSGEQNSTYPQIYSCSSSDAVGAPVRFTGNRTVTTADASNSLRSMVFGFISEKPSSTTCRVVHFYYHSGVSSFSGFSGYHGGAVYLTNNSGFSGLPGTHQKIIGESISPTEALLNATPLSAVTMSRRKNVIINGNFDLWQRAGSGSVNVATTGAYTYGADRFRGLPTNAISYTFTRSTDVPTFQQSGAASKYSLLTDCAATGGSVASDQISKVDYVIEGFDWSKIAHKPLILSFWIKSSKSGEHAISLYSSSANVSFVYTYRVDVVDTWEKKIIPIFPSDSTLSWNYDSQEGIVLSFPMAIGTDFHTTTTNRWISGEFYGTSNTVFIGALNTDNFKLSQVQLESNPVATPFEKRSIATELLMAQRYYQKTFPFDTAPAYNTGTAGTLHYKWISNVANRIGIHWLFKITMRTTPTIAFFYPNGVESPGTTNRWANLTTAGTSGTASANSTGETGVTIFNSSGTATVGDTIAIHSTADADFY